MATAYRIGVVVAAGRGRRLGGTKQLAGWRTPAGEKPLVAAAYDAIRPMCDEIVVVLGHEAGAVAAALGERDFHACIADPDAPMFESIRAGLRAAHALSAAATVVLQPGDHPDVARSTLEALIAWSGRCPAQAILPQHAGRGGHPVLIPPGIVQTLSDADCPGGLKRFWRDHPELCQRVDVDDPGVVRDIDTADDLAG